jgi:hypothetical protein
MADRGLGPSGGSLLARHPCVKGRGCIANKLEARCSSLATDTKSHTCRTLRLPFIALSLTIKTYSVVAGAVVTGIDTFFLRRRQESQPVRLRVVPTILSPEVLLETRPTTEPKAEICKLSPSWQKTRTRQTLFVVGGGTGGWI